MDQSPLTLLSLPPELLIQIFYDVYNTWEEVQFPETRRPPVVPLCKSLEEIQLEALYKTVKINVDGTLRQFNSFFAAIGARPQLANFVTSLTFAVPQINPWGSSQASSNSLRQHFRLFVNLQNLHFDMSALQVVPQLSSLFSADSLSSSLTSIRFTTFPEWSLYRLKSLPVNVRSLDFAFNHDHSAFVVHGPPQATKSLSRSLSNILDLSLRRPGDLFSIVTHIISHCNNLASLNLLEVDSQPHLDAFCNALPSPSCITRLTISAIQDSALNVDALLGKFPNLNKLTLGRTTSTYSAVFFEALCQLPLTSLVLEKCEPVPLASLRTLVSSSTRHSTLRNLILNFFGHEAKVGKRAADVKIPSLFRKFSKADVSVFLLSLVCRRSTFPQGFSIDDFIDLQRVGKENGVVVDGAVFKAIRVEQAYEADKKLLEEIWEDWRRDEMDLVRKLQNWRI